MRKILRNFRFTLICLAVGMTSLLVICHYDYSVSVPGTVIAKNTEMETRYKSHVINDVYRVAIRPDNPNYPVYDVKVNFSTYVTLQKGQHTSFKINNPEMSISDDIIYQFCVFLLILSSIVFIIAFIIEISNLY